MLCRQANLWWLHRDNHEVTCALHQLKDFLVLLIAEPSTDSICTACVAPAVLKLQFILQLKLSWD